MDSITDRLRRFCLYIVVVSAGVLSLFAGAMGNTAVQREPLTLQQAFALAFENNESIKIVREEMEKDKLLIPKANALILPTVNISGAYSKWKDEIEYDPSYGDITVPPVTTVPETQFVANLNYTQPIYQAEWGPRRRQADQAIERSESEYIWMCQGILFEVARSFYESIKYQKYIDVSKEDLSRSYEEKRIADIKLNKELLQKMLSSTQN